MEPDFGGTPSIFRVRIHHFQFRALDAVHFPAYGAGNILRGALGTVLEESVFRRRLESGPSGLADPPRPFVLRAAHLNGRTFSRDEAFHFDIHTFDRENNMAASLAGAFSRLRTRAFGFIEATPAGEVSFDLDRPQPAARVRIRFVSPTELKGASEAEPLAFPALFARVRDRLAALRQLYGEGALDVDFRGLGERARAVRTVSCDVRYCEISRQSYRSGQVHGIGGFIGNAEYAGELGEFAPWLLAARWAGAGRHTVWGNGEIEPAFEI